MKSGGRVIARSYLGNSLFPGTALNLFYGINSLMKNLITVTLSLVTLCWFIYFGIMIDAFFVQITHSN